MAPLQSSSDSILVAIPMVFIMFAGFFRLDEAFSKPKTTSQVRRGLTDWDENGVPLCVEPDGKVAGRKRRPTGKIPQKTAPVAAMAPYLEVESGNVV